jgi:hypothetical protein
MSIGAEPARAELIKLQVTFKAVLLENQLNQKKAQEVIKGLVEQKGEVEKTLEHEREMNESNARRVEQLEDTVEALERAIKWSREERDAA